MKRRSLFSPYATALWFILINTSAHACTVCMGDTESPFAEATNAAIFLMLGLIGCVLGLLSVFALYLHRRSLAPLPPHAEVGQGLEPQGEGAGY